MYGTDGTQNATHGSDSPISAMREIKFYFPGLVLEPLLPADMARDYISQLPWGFATILAWGPLPSEGVQSQSLIQAVFARDLGNSVSRGPRKPLKASIGGFNGLLGRKVADQAKGPACTDSPELDAEKKEALRCGTVAKIWGVKPNIRLQPALSKALTALAREKPSAERFEAITFLADYLLKNNPNKPRIVMPDQWDPRHAFAYGSPHGKTLSIYIYPHAHCFARLRAAWKKMMERTSLHLMSSQHLRLSAVLSSRRPPFLLPLLQPPLVHLQPRAPSASRCVVRGKDVVRSPVHANKVDVVDGNGGGGGGGGCMPCGRSQQSLWLRPECQSSCSLQTRV
eukprot:730013-Pelagomonas_calceolata.AAC.1